MRQPEITLAVCSATGAIYARWLLSHLAATPARISLVISPRASQIIRDELDIASLEPSEIAGLPVPNVTIYDWSDLAAPISSGSSAPDAMIICPCSSNTLASVAAGLADNLISRAAAVCLKQKKPLVLVHREAPLTLIDIENMSRVARAGGIIFPASPVFYTDPRSIDDLASNLALRVIELAGVQIENPNRWNPPR